MDSNGFEYIANEETPVQKTDTIQDEQCSLPEWDLLPPFDEVERGEE